jgi:CRISPR-associated protein Cmr2
MTHLFLFTLSPVQSFIAQARKAQDLYAGSRILSELARTAAQEAKTQGVELIFPLSLEGRSCPNRFIGKLEGDFDKDALCKKGESIEAVVQEKFIALASEALKTINLSGQKPKGFDTQIWDHLDINWLFHDYEAYKEIDHLMAALKNERHISNQQPEKGRKCSLDGERNALFFGPGTNEQHLRLNSAKIVGKGVWLKPNEGLSAVSMVKRAYKEEGRQFPSTAKVALSHQINALSTQNQKILACYQKLFSLDFTKACAELITSGELTNLRLSAENSNWRTEFDEQLLYEENLTASNIPNNDQLDIAKKTQKKLAPYLTHKYYALISFDGDKMGTLLSGETRKDQSGDLSLFQGRVSERLGVFSKWIYKDLDNPSGESQNGKMDVIYAGGDDFLGLANLNDLFKVVKELRHKFDELVNKPLRPELESDITFSMGIAIAHYKEPLSIVLQTARDMEKLAKTKGERNAFAIAALKHSGDNHQAFFKWGTEGDTSKWKALEELVGYFQKDDCSDTFARSLGREFYALQDSKGLVDGPDMFKLELLRLGSRSLPPQSKLLPEDLSNTVMYFFEEKSTLLRQSIAVSNGIEAVNIALFLKRNNKQKKQTAHGHQD